MIDKNRRPTKLLWLDMEMTGLDPRKDVILEIVAQITDFNFKELGAYSAVVHQPESALDAANEWCKTTFSANGLFDRVRASEKSEKTVSSEFASFITTHFG